ncbi:MAG: hypothetical protein K0Q51_148 [Rickettsiaceae bacterium]|jgi:hypothetical protein|nr:hypothetical protein [Rickettsiaceae bacterium]
MLEAEKMRLFITDILSKQGYTEYEVKKIISAIAHYYEIKQKCMLRLFDLED